MTREVFENPDMGLMFHKLSTAQSAGFASFKDCLTEIQVEFGKVSQRTSYTEEAVKELRANDAIILEMARNLTGQQQQNADMRDNLKLLLAKVDVLVQGQTNLDSARSEIVRDIESINESIKGLKLADDAADDYLTTIKASVNTITWVVSGLSAVALLLAVWFVNIVMEDNKFINENRRAIEQLQHNREREEQNP